MRLELELIQSRQMRPKTLRVVEGLDSIGDVQRRLAIRTVKIISRRSERLRQIRRGKEANFLRNQVKKTTRCRFSERCAANSLDQSGEFGNVFGGHRLEFQTEPLAGLSLSDDAFQADLPLRHKEMNMNQVTFEFS
jgi:hypothetical protein